MRMKQLGILTLYLNEQKIIEEKKIYEEMTRIGAKLGLEVIVFTPEDVNANRTEVLAHTFDIAQKRWRRKWSIIPDYILDRCRFQHSNRMKKLREFKMVHPEIKFLNKPLGNKWTVHKRLLQHQYLQSFLPETILYQGIHSIKYMLTKHPIIFLKPINGTGGRGIIRIERKDNNKLLIQGRDLQRKILPEYSLKPNQLMKFLQKYRLQEIKYLVQQGINLQLANGRVHDYRILVQKNNEGNWTVSGVAGRVGAVNSVTANLHGGGTAVPMDELIQLFVDSRVNKEALNEQLTEMAIELSKYLENTAGALYELAIDIAIDKNGKIWIIEINPKPAREVFRELGDRHTYLNAIKRPLEYAKYKMNL